MSVDHKSFILSWELSQCTNTAADTFHISCANICCLTAVFGCFSVVCSLRAEQPQSHCNHACHRAAELSCCCSSDKLVWIWPESWPNTHTLFRHINWQDTLPPAVSSVIQQLNFTSISIWFLPTCHRQCCSLIGSVSSEFDSLFIVWSSQSTV